MARKLSELVAPTLRKALGKQAPAVIELMKNWDEVVGKQTAAQARCRGVRFPTPGSRKGGTLKLEVNPAAALFVQQDQVRILNRVNDFLGPETVTHLVIQQRDATK